MGHGRWHMLVIAGLGAVAAGCRVGPEYSPPAKETPRGYIGVDQKTTSLPLPDHSSHAVTESADLSRWWELIGDPVLTSLIERAQQGNLDLEAARARILQAREAVTIAESANIPSVGVGASASRARSGSGRTANAYRASLDASWEIDIFGGNRRAVEAAQAGLLSQVESRRNVMVTLLGDVATTYFDLRGAQSQLATARRNLEAQRTTLDLTRLRFDAGFVSALDVASSEAQVAATTSRIPSLEARVRQSIYALGVLLGQTPESLLVELSPDRAVGPPPPEVPVGLPSDLLERRPDIRVAEAQLRIAAARIGIATADLYPRFALNASIGTGGARFDDVFDLANRFWSIGPSVSWPIFQGGALRANLRAEEAAAAEALANYKQIVLTALQEVETDLVNFQNEQARLGALLDSADANRRAVDLSLQLYSAGRTDFLNVLVAQRTLFSAEDELAQSRTQVLINLVALYKALGGGWDPEDSAP